MSMSRWLVCEGTTHWAAALRIALEASPSSERNTSITLDEVRTLTDCTTRLRDAPFFFTFVEVTPTNVAEALTWLAAMSGTYRRCVFVALVDYQLQLPDSDPAAYRAGAVTSEIVAALREAGAADVVLSPRQLKSILQSFHDVEHNTLSHKLAAPEPAQSVEAWAWSLLPWQETGRPVG